MKTRSLDLTAKRHVPVEAGMWLPEQTRSQKLWELRRRLLRLDYAFSFTVVAILLICLIGAPWITTYDPYAVDLKAATHPPSLEHWMGTDDYGRDIFTRVVYGSRYSLGMGLIVTMVATLIGVILGGTAGFLGGRVDELIMRFTDMVMGFPAILFAMIIAAILGSNLTNAIIAAAAVWWPSYVRLLRGQVLSVKNDLYVEAVRSIGATNVRILMRHILPNSWAPIIVRSTMDLGRAVIFTGTLSFIGLGAQPPSLSGERCSPRHVGLSWMRGGISPSPG